MPLLPFLKNKHKDVGVIVQHRAPDSPEQAAESDSGLHAAAQDMLSAISSGDAARLAQAVKAAFQILESQPHEEALPIESDEGME